MNKNGLSVVGLILVIGMGSLLFVGSIFIFAPDDGVQKSRDTRRIQELQSIVHAIRLGEVDGNIGNSDISPLLWQIGTATSSCDISCAVKGENGLVAERITQKACLDLKSMLKKTLPQVPTDPVLGTIERTGYAVQRDALGNIQAVACHPEEVESITIRR
ncbi:MAG: hypothetical protein HOE53_05005 [Candidatus Magasanikbacteria bacterium]|jgi:hypothetical protein|nr:hypothetical protein [Candidatus Magasanikbacteria bacterium]